jgi:hypothetical protein
MTSTKATAGWVASQLVIITAYLLTRIPWWAVLPMEVQGACLALVTGAIGWVTVYYAPSNQHTVDAPLRDAAQP